MTTAPAAPTRPLALAYIRVSTEDQAEHGASLDAQRAALAAEAQRRGWDVEVVADEGLSGKSLNRPGLQSALARLDRGEADVLLAVRLDRVSRSVADFAGLLDRCQRRGWELVLLSPNIDTADPAGRFTANVLASAAQYERELISQRTREGMAQRKAEGVRFGRPNEIPDEVRERILRMRAEGVRVSHIARALTEEGVPTARGGAVWRSSTIDRVLAQAAELSTAA
ncbi:recombinase family protein [Micrococcus luteus]|uniref:recombinase family protein n=1 Tax=Micrococcus luteus TaxID=1270 RepID=UPI001C22A6DC|nr:recombinase family protein [Micrococcus luteus]MBU8793217.1 recombinase family protein [Micrococcus luteus]